jgi:hypothetical protein
MAILLLVLVSRGAACLETDQYYAWGHQLDDSTALLNAKLNLEIEIAVETVNARWGGPPAQCIQVARQLRSQMHFNSLHDLEVWLVNSSLVSRVPSGDEEEQIYRTTNLYRIHGPLDIGMWLLISPTIEAGGVRFGTDKLAHFISSGWRWYRGYRQAIANGMSPEEAELRILRTGVLHERLGLGGWSTGVISLGDLEANYQGMLFYDSLCHGDDPILELAGGRWQVRRPYDITTAISPEWDESYLPPIFNTLRWRKVKPVLRSYCDRLDEPTEQARRRYYRSIDTVTAIEGIVAALIEDGKLKSPSHFSLDRVCGAQPGNPAGDHNQARLTPIDVATTGEAEEAIKGQIKALDASAELRHVGLLGLHLSRPERVTGSVGVLFAQVPSSFSCKYVCTYSGSLVQVGAGLSGGRLSAGWGKVVGERRGNRFFLSDVLVGYAIKGTAMHTWYDPIGTEPGRWYLGGELEGTIVRVNFRMGLFYQVADHGEHSPWLLSAGLGWGF